MTPIRVTHSPHDRLNVLLTGANALYGITSEEAGEVVGTLLRELDGEPLRTTLLQHYPGLGVASEMGYRLACVCGMEIGTWARDDDMAAAVHEATSAHVIAVLCGAAP